MGQRDQAKALLDAIDIKFEQVYNSDATQDLKIELFDYIGNRAKRLEAILKAKRDADEVERDAEAVRVLADRFDGDPAV